jgi:hypothetical protein
VSHTPIEGGTTGHLGTKDARLKQRQQPEKLFELVDRQPGVRALCEVGDRSQIFANGVFDVGERFSLGVALRPASGEAGRVDADPLVRAFENDLLSHGVQYTWAETLPATGRLQLPQYLQFRRGGVYGASPTREARGPPPNSRSSPGRHRRRQAAGASSTREARDDVRVSRPPIGVGQRDTRGLETSRTRTWSPEMTSLYRVKAVSSCSTTLATSSRWASDNADPRCANTFLRLACDSCKSSVGMQKRVAFRTSPASMHEPFDSR